MQTFSELFFYIDKNYDQDWKKTQKLWNAFRFTVPWQDFYSFFSLFKGQP